MNTYGSENWKEDAVEPLGTTRVEFATPRSGEDHPASDIDFAGLDLMDALDLAILIEEEAAERYVEFSGLVGTGFVGDASDLFKAMAAGERIHGDQLITRRWRLFQDTPRRVRREMIFDVEAPGHHRIHAYMSPREALQVAFEAEQKAYEYYTEALPFVEDPDARELFRQLQTEEKEHRELLAWRLRDLPAEREVAESHVDEPPAL